MWINLEDSNFIVFLRSNVSWVFNPIRIMQFLELRSLFKKVDSYEEFILVE